MMDAKIQEIIESSFHISKIGKKWHVVFGTSHIIWEGKDEIAAKAVLDLCFKDDLGYAIQQAAKRFADIAMDADTNYHAHQMIMVAAGLENESE